MRQQCEWVEQTTGKWELHLQPSNLKVFSLHFPPAILRKDMNSFKESTVSKNLLILKNSPGLHRIVHYWKPKGKGCWEIQFVSIKEHQLILILDGRQAPLLLKVWLAPRTTGVTWAPDRLFLHAKPFHKPWGSDRDRCSCRRNIWSPPPPRKDPCSYSTHTCSMPLAFPCITYSTNWILSPSITQR